MRRLIGFVVLGLVAIGSTTACGGGHRPPQVPSEAPRVFEEVAVPSCWDPALAGPYSDWFNNGGSSVATQVTIEDLRIDEGLPGRVVCQGTLRAGETLRGPAIWAHRNLQDGTEWSVSGKSYITVVSLDRKKGVVDTSDADMLYSKGYGWYFRCSTCNINNQNEEN